MCDMLEWLDSSALRTARIFSPYPIVVDHRHCRALTLCSVLDSVTTH